MAKKHAVKKNKKIQIYCNHTSALFLRLGFVFLFYFLSRLLFLVFNIDSLLQKNETEPFSYWILLFLGGSRFDLFVISIINAPYIFSNLIPFRLRENRYYNLLTKLFLFYIPNIVAFLFNFIDIIYSRFTQKRMTFDVFKFVKTEGGFIELIPEFIRDFWYIIIIFLIIVCVFIWSSQRISINYKKSGTNTKHYFIVNSLIFIITLSACFVGVRGGVQLRPISILTASHYAKPKHYSLVLNTPFTLIKTIFYENLDKVNYFSEKELKEKYIPVYIPQKKSNFKPYNIVVLILESFSLEYSSILNPNAKKSYIPVFDSIGRQSLIMPAFANGIRSMEGIPAIIASIPTLMNNEYITSNYSENEITSLPSLLKKHGYKSAFFHGGKNGTLNFDSFTKIAGFDYYYGKNEYNNDAHYDGSWGIFDDYFLKFSANKLDNMQQPFFASIFTLSSHHPYKLPEHYRKKFSINETGIKESIMYADWSLGIFFEEAKKSDWYKNTIFVLTADHASQSEDPLFMTQAGKFAIPIVFFIPDTEIRKTNKTFTQQLDILPSILDLINYQDSVFTFGKSVFNENFIPFAINYSNNIYQFFTEDYMLMFNGEALTAIYSIKEDPYLNNNLLLTAQTPKIEYNLLKAIIQTYNSSLIENKLTIDKYNKTNQ